MTAASEGVTERRDVVRESARILLCESVPNADKGEESKNPKILRISLMDVP